MTIREVKKQARLEEWCTYIQEQKTSGLTIRQWCEQHSCGEGRYYYWLKLVREHLLAQMETASSATLVRITPERLPSTSRPVPQPVESYHALGSIIVRFNNLSIELPGETSAPQMAELVKLLSHD